MSQENMDNRTVLQIDEAAEAIVIQNKLGIEIGVFYFRPTDTGIVDRYNEALKRVENISEVLRLREKDSDENVIAALNEAKEKICDAFDYLFDANVGEAFFSRTSPFTLAGGRFYFENVLEAIGGFIQQRLGVELDKVSVRVSKYTDAYQKHGQRTGKHKNGR